MGELEAVLKVDWTPQLIVVVAAAAAVIKEERDKGGETVKGRGPFEMSFKERVSSEGEADPGGLVITSAG